MPRKGDFKKNPTKEARRQRKYQTPEAKRRRAMRMRARRRAVKEGRVKPGDGKELDHKRPLIKGGSNARSNTRVTSRKKNRQRGAALANKSKRPRSVVRKRGR